MIKPSGRGISSIYAKSQFTKSISIEIAGLTEYLMKGTTVVTRISVATIHMGKGELRLIF